MGYSGREGGGRHYNQHQVWEISSRAYQEEQNDANFSFIAWTIIRIPSERAPREERNGTNFSFIAPSSEEL